jgi:hypothetical protein
MARVPTMAEEDAKRPVPMERVPKFRFAADSLLEEDGFELAVPPSAKGKAMGSHSRQALPFRT